MHSYALEGAPIYPRSGAVDAVERGRVPEMFAGPILPFCDRTFSARAARDATRRTIPLLPPLFKLYPEKELTSHALWPTPTLEPQFVINITDQSV